MPAKYFYILRPPSYAHQPDGFMAREDSLEAYGESRHSYQTPIGERLAWGWVEYPERLPFEESWRFDLLPADPEEWAERYFWIDSRSHDEDWTRTVLENAIAEYNENKPYFETPEGKAALEGDLWWQAAKILAEARHGHE